MGSIRFLNNKMTASIISVIRKGGFPSFLTVAMSAALMVSNAASAASRAGLASASFSSATAVSAAITLTSCTARSFTSRTSAFTTSAAACDSATASSTSSALAVASLISSSFTSNSCLKISTLAAASTSLLRPVVILLAISAICVCLSEYNLLYPSRKDKYDLGVT
ncbi:unnamed protein product [Chrysodeixis includens]|uniref:Uncharacterized protein n=1 Tax=Chrysodeixis includens TaxID=689277 RepID=A0A9N8KPM1_CHRIL|nr:unnamed protein product [Chrysodeixis includens]